MKFRILLVLFVLVGFLKQTFTQKVYRATEGQWNIVEIDTITPLDKLIGRLELPWKFVETGKHYWIGYTDDMFSIAQYKDRAIKPLIELISNTASSKTKIGALYTIHLIGIDSKIAGRFKENFIDTLARNALISYLNNNELHETVLLLLMRDPWPGDIPYLMDYLSNPKNETSRVLSALQRYNLDNKPFGQKIPDELLREEIVVVTTKPYSREPIYDMLALQKISGDKLIIDNEILDSKEWKDGVASLRTEKTQTERQNVGTLIEFLTHSVFSYCDFTNRFFYIYKNKTITIYGPEKAREIWLDWWKENKVNMLTKAKTGHTQ